MKREEFEVRIEVVFPNQKIKYLGKFISIQQRVIYLDSIKISLFEKDISDKRIFNALIEKAKRSIYCKVAVNSARKWYAKYIKEKYNIEGIDPNTIIRILPILTKEQIYTWRQVQNNEKEA